MSRQKSLFNDQTVVSKLHLQKQTLKIKNVGLKHQLSLLKTELQSLIIKCKQLSRVKENLYCLLEKTRIEKLTAGSVEDQNRREGEMKEEIGRLKEGVKAKGEESRVLGEEYERYVKELDSVVGEVGRIEKKIAGTEGELLFESTELKEIKNINFDLEKMKRVLQEEKQTTIAFQAGSKISHEEFEKKYTNIIQRLMNDQVKIIKNVEQAQRKYAFLAVNNLITERQLGYYREFWRVRGDALQGESSLKCIDNVSKIADKVWKENIRRMFSCWFKNVFDSKKVVEITENVIVLNTEQRIKFKVFSKLDEEYNAEHVRLLKQYDRVKLVCQLKMRFARKDMHSGWNRWVGRVREWRERVAGLKRVGKVMSKMAKSAAVQRWRDCLTKARQQQQTTTQTQQLQKLKTLSFSLNQIQKLKFLQSRSHLSTFFKKTTLLSKIRSQHNYIERTKRTFNVLNYQHQKNELRSGFYIYRAKCLKLRAIETEEMFRMVKKEGEVTKKTFKATLNVKGELRKKLLISFLGRYLSNKDLFYQRKLGNLLTKWQRNLFKIHGTTKSALRKTKLSVFSLLLTHGIKKKYRISPSQIELLKNKKLELDIKQQQEITKIAELEKQCQRISLMKVHRMVENKFHMNKLELFRIGVGMKGSEMKRRNLGNLMERVVKVGMMRKGFEGVKRRSVEVRVDLGHERKLREYERRKVKKVQLEIFKLWREYNAGVKKVQHSLLKISSWFIRDNFMVALKSIKFYNLTYYQNTCTKNISEFKQSLINQQLSSTAIEQQQFVAEKNAQTSLRAFYESINSHLTKRVSNQKKAALKEYINRWRQTTLKLSESETKLLRLLNKINMISLQQSFSQILRASILNIREQYKQKISLVLKKDKINEMKIQKGEATFGEQYKKQKQNNQLIVKELNSREGRYNSYMRTHQEYYRELNTRSLLVGCWKGWKRNVVSKRFCREIERIVNRNRKSKAWKCIGEEGRENLWRDKRLSGLMRLVEVSKEQNLERSFNCWRRTAELKVVEEMKGEIYQLSQTIAEKQQQYSQLKESEVNFIITTKTHKFIYNIFKLWKQQTQQQRSIQTKQQTLNKLRKSLLVKQTLTRFLHNINFTSKQNLLQTTLSKSKKLKQRKALLHFSLNIKTIKNLLKLLSTKLSHTQTNHTHFAFTRMQRAAAYKHLAFTYQQKKVSFRLMSSLITQSNLNKQKVLYSFLSNEKTYHYLPNILYRIQKKTVQGSFYKLREVGYYNKDLIMRQSECIMESQKYLINMEMRQMALERINGRELKEYLDERVESDAVKMKQVIGRLRLQGAKKRLVVKCWNSWVEKIKLRRMAQEKLGRVVEYNDSVLKYWNRWKRTNNTSETSLITLSRDQLTVKHNQLEKLSVFYSRELLEMRSEIAELRFLNNTQEPKLIKTTQIALNRMSQCFTKGLSSVLKSWKQRAGRRVDKSKKYDDLTRYIEQLLSKRAALMHSISEVNASNNSLRDNCKEGGVQVERLKDLLVQKQNLSISLADKKHNIKILLQDNVKIKQKLKQAQGQAMKLVHEFKPLMDRTNL